MNITFLVNRDLHACVALNLLRPLFEKHRITIFLSEKVGVPKSNWSPCESLQQLKFLEQTLFNQVITPLAAKQSSKEARFLTFSELSEQCHSMSVLENINKPEGLEIFSDSEPELVISIRFGKIIKEPVIAVPKLGVINLHSGLLPEYQGILTTLHALNADEEQVGCTLHYIDSGDIDTGEIINTASLQVDKTRSLFWHVAQLYPLGTKMIIDAVQVFDDDERPKSYSQDVSRQAYFGLPEAEHFELVRQKGFDIYQSQDVIELYQRFI